MTPSERGNPLVVYAGRSWRDVADLAGARVLGDHDVDRVRLASAVEGAPLCCVLDPLSLPWELLNDRHWDCPMVVALPPDLDAATIQQVLGAPLLRHLQFFDRVATDRPNVFEELARSYGWASSQLLLHGAEDWDGIVKECSRLVEQDRSTTGGFHQHVENARAYWIERGKALASVAPHRAVGSVVHDLRRNKEMHRVQERALRCQREALASVQPTTREFRVLEVGAGVGRWAGLFGAAEGAYVGVDVSPDMVQTARRNYPHARFHVLDEELRLPFPDEHFDAALTVTTLHHNPRPAKRRLLEQMWRVVRPSGRLLLLEDVVASRKAQNPTVFPMSVGKLVDLVAEATRARVTLEHVEALRYPHDDVHRAALLVFTTLSVPRTL